MCRFGAVTEEVNKKSCATINKKFKRRYQGADLIGEQRHFYDTKWNVMELLEMNLFL